MSIRLVNHGDFKKSNSFLERCLELVDLGFLNEYGQLGVDALSSATPVRTGKTAASWVYKIERSRGTVSIIWENTNIVNTSKGPTSVAILLQYGHGTGRGGYVRGRDYINPAMQPVFDQIANDAWKGLVDRL